MHSQIVDIHEKPATDATRMAVVHAHAEENSNGSIDRRAAQIEDASEM